MSEELPTFRTIRQHHAISLEALYEYAEGDIDMEVIRLFDETGRANPYMVDDLLYILSQLSGQSYTRANVDGIIFVLARPPADPTHPQPQKRLSIPPKLLEIYYAYHLDLDWIGEAVNLSRQTVWDLLTGQANDQPTLEHIFHLISQYIGVNYTPCTVGVATKSRQRHPPSPSFSAQTGHNQQ